MKKPNINSLVTYILMAIYGVTFLIDIFTTQSISYFHSFMCMGSLAAFYIFLRKIPKMYYLGIVSFAFLATYLGGMLDFYSLISIYDLFLHFTSGILLVFLGHFVYGLLLKRSPSASVPISITILFCGLCSMASAAGWEIWEFSGDVLFGLTSQGSNIADTMTDIIAGTIGAVIGSAVLYFILKKNKTKGAIA